MTFAEFFTDSARRALQAAEAEARRMGHQHLGSEHVLLGLLHDRDIAGTLTELGAPPTSVRVMIENLVDIDPFNRSSPAGPLPYSAHARRAIEDLTPREVELAGLNYVSPGHLLLALIRDDNGLAGQVLARLGVNLTRARRHVHPRRGDQ